MKYIKYFEGKNPGKFKKAIPIIKGDKTIYRNQTVGSAKRFTKQHFVYLEHVFGDKLKEYQNWLLSLYKLRYYNDKNIFVNTDLEIYRLYALDQAYRLHLIKLNYPGRDGSKEIAKKGQEIRERYLDQVFSRPGRPDIYSIIHIKGASVNSPVKLNTHPYLNEIGVAANPPVDVEQANVIAGSELGKQVLDKREKLKNVENYHRNKAVNIIISDFNRLMDSIDFLNETASKIYNLIKKSMTGSKTYFGEVILNNDSEIIITKNGKENIRTLKQLMDYLKTIPNSKVGFDKIELRVE